MSPRPVRPAVLLALPLILLAGLQLVPYGRDHSAPADGQKVVWDSPRTLELARRACFDCHSHETRWPWYANLAPISWRIQNHVQEGREAIDFSAFVPGNEDVAEAAGEAAETVQKGEMPPFDYRLAHPEARLTPAEQRDLIAGLKRTFATFAGKEGDRKAGAAVESSEGAESAEHEAAERKAGGGR